jgi:protein SCO1/2
MGGCLIVIGDLEIWGSGDLKSAIAATFALALSAASLVAGCHRSEPAKRYTLQGQIFAVRADRQQLTIKHGDIVGLMPGMTMSFPVASPKMLEGRTAGEIVSASLEVRDMVGTLVDVTHVGWEPLPDLTNEVALATGLLNVGDKIPDTAFIDQNDHRRSWSEWNGTTTLVTFIYTSCPLPNFCPLMDQNFATIQRSVAKEALLKGRVKLVTISFDPARDTPAVLLKHALHLQSDPDVWTFLTGDRVTIERFAGGLGVGVIRAPDAPGGITHNLRTTLVGADGRIVRIYSGSDWTPGQVLTDLRRAVGPPK